MDSRRRTPPPESSDVLARHADLAHALPKPGDVIAGKYLIDKVVGEGGMGIVYGAHHLVLGTRVALKLVLVDERHGEELVERFVREAKAAARLQSEHVARVTDAGALDSGLPFLVMEFLEGCDLAELLHVEGPLPSEDVADMMLQALAALAQAHAAGIVHRDLKPANLFLALRDDGANVVKVLDFGISKQQPATGHWKELTGKAVLGTPAYMSPEQLRSSRSVDARADLWSLGVVIHELLTAKRPFHGDAPGELFAAILETIPARVRTHRESLPEAWDAIVARCLERDPAARFEDAAALAVAIAPLGSGRMAHLLASIAQACHRPSIALPQTDTALVDAAVRAANTSFPPPGDPDAMATRPLGDAFATGKTIFANSVASTPPRARSRLPLASSVAVAAVILISGATVLVRGGGHPASAAALPPAPSASFAPKPPEPPPVAEPAAPEPRPYAELPAATVSVPKASPVSSAARKPPPAPARKPRPVEARPTFLKSWR